MAKPILVTRIPRDISNNELDYLHNKLVELCSDYNVITIPTGTVDRIEFEVFNVQDYPQVDFDQLRQLVKST